MAMLALAWASCIKKPIIDTVPRRDTTKAEAIHFVLVATNDWHGQLFATKESGVQEALPRGGALTFFSMLSVLREAFPERVLWVDAGDIFHGEWAVHETRGQLAAEAFSLMGLDFAAIGSSDFDLGPSGPQEEAQGALKACMLRAKFPWSSANIYSTADGTRPAWMGGGKLHMVERQGIHIGFVGLTTPTTVQLSPASHLRGLYFGDMVLAAKEGAVALREKGAELVVLVAHVQGGCVDSTDKNCELQEGELKALLEDLPEGLVDVVVVGHSHKPLGHFSKGMPVVQTQGRGKSFSFIHLYWEPTEHRLLRDKTQLQLEIPICEKTWPGRQSCEGPPGPGEEAEPALFLGKPLQRDDRLAVLLEPASKKHMEKQQEWLGVEVGEPLALGEGEESALGGMWAESLWLATKADVALMNREALREGLAAGALSAGRLHQSMPYDSRVALVRFTGEELRRLMQLAFGQTRFRFDVAGVELRLRCFPSGRRRVQTELVSADGRRRAVQDKAFYWVAMPDFLAQGGNGLEGLWVEAPPRQVKLQKGLREEVVHFWLQRREALVSPLRPRILWEDALDSCTFSKEPP